MQSNIKTDHTDIRTDGWWRWLPVSWHRYIYLARLDRPIGWWLLLLPGCWSIALGASTLGQMMWLISLFTLGAIITRAGGCIINDMWDRQLDQKVARTTQRPLASGAISMPAASLFLVILGVLGFLILLQLPLLAVYVGIGALPLVVVYPLAKRVTWFPQFILGLTFSWGVLLGWAAADNSLPSPAIMLIYAGCTAWVFGFDTIYAIQDMDDDRIAGVKSSALALAQQIKSAVGIAYGLAILAIGGGLYLHGLAIKPTDSFIWGGLILMALHLGNQVRLLRLNDAPLALRLFKSNRDAGLLLAAGLILARLV